MSHTHHHYVTPMPVLIGTFLALVVLTLLTVYQATQTHVDFGRFEVLLTLVIATAKAALVALLFMQLAHDKPLNGIILLSSLIFVSLFLIFALMDTHEYKPQLDDYQLDNPKTAETPT